MRFYVNNKNYFKEKSEIQRAIKEGLKTLDKRISAYESQGVPFEKIFDDDKVKYDKHGDFYTFKYRKGNIQLRILYSYLGENSYCIADYYVKKRNQRKEHIHLFDLFNGVNAQSMLVGSTLCTV